MLVAEKPENLGRGGEMVGNGRGRKPSECRQVSPVTRDRFRHVGCGLARKETALRKERLEHARDGGEIRIIVRMARSADPEVRGTDCLERVDTTPGPPLLESTSSAHMAPNRDPRIPTVLQPACKVTQDRAEQPQRRISPVHPRKQLDEHRSLQRAGADIGTRQMLDASFNVKPVIDSAAI
jgi:hypothetical protein